MVAYIQTTAGLNLVINRKPVSVSNRDKHYDEIIKALKAGASEAEVADILEKELNRITAATQLTDDIVIKGGELYFQDEIINNTLSARILKMVDEGFVLTPMVNFLTNLMANPSNRVTEQLYAFLEKGKNAITEDGHFLAYKAVREDFKDIHSGTFDNSIGQTVAIARRKVDEDQNKTCSYGLHVCSFDYLPHFSHANGHVMICKVNPADVVAIPADYNHTKMRVCRYEVIGEFEDYYDKSAPADDVLGSTTVLNGSGNDADFPFAVNVFYGASSAPKLIGYFRKIREASDQVDEELNDDTVFSATITNRVTGIEVHREENPDYDGDNFSNDDAPNEEYEVRSVKHDGSYVVTDSFDDLGDAKMAAIDVDLEGLQKVQVVEVNSGNVMLNLS
jgi:hypothetical protein